MFRVSASNPEILPAAGCGYKPEEFCSDNAFLVDTAHQYAVSKAPDGDWSRGKPLPGSDSLRNPKGYSPPYSLEEIDPKGGVPGNGVGWTFLGRSYYHRGD